MVHAIRLAFSHFVVAREDGTVFASARDTSSKVHNYLITRYGDVKEQVKDHFEPIADDYANWVKKQAQAYYSIRPIYRIGRLNFS